MLKGKALRLIGTIIIATMLLATISVQAANWPTRPITIVVGFGAGGFTDLFARMVGAEMGKILNTSVAVVNMAGGTGGIAADYVMRASKDGYTIWAMSDALRLQAVMGYHNTTYKNWYSMVTASFGGVISVKEGSPYKTIADLVKAIKANPGKVTMSASSPGTTWHTELLIMERFTGLSTKFVSYAGSHPAQVGAMAGEVDAVLTGIGEQAELIRGGKLIPLAVFDNKPYSFTGYGVIPAITDVLPELKPALPFGAWVGLSYPSDIPADIIKTVDEAYKAALKVPTIVDFAKTNHCELLGLTGSAATDFIKKDTSLVSWLMYEIGSTKTSPNDFGIPKL